ncbi:MAG: aldo/keto reductase [Planctomycetota bacterium]
MDAARADRYTARPAGWFRRCGRSGLKLPAVSLGCWHNFGGPGTDSARSTSEAEIHENARAMLSTAFDLGITHFDLANNYGPPPGSAEERVGRLLASDFAPYRDELIISSKAGYRMWDGPYGEWGSRKYLIASCEQSLRRLRVDYVDIFYSHRPDPDTPLEETLGALDTLVRQGKALYVGISSYSAEMTRRVDAVCRANGLVRPIIHQPRYSMLDHGIERDGLLDAFDETGMGSIAFSPLEGGVLTGKYLDGSIPTDSRAANEHSPFLREGRVRRDVERCQRLNEVAVARGQTLAQLALLWVLRDQGGRSITSALIGASRPSQIEQCAACLDAGLLGADELTRIELILAD